MAVGVASVYTYDVYKTKRATQTPAANTAQVAPAPSQFDRRWGQPSAGSPPPSRPSSYRCDGRTHCSQMRSCAEATYFIQHCPNTKMDGDRDGVPCENQWCS
ncbi:excalibur calcium-binding domain-containing protein [Pseudoxanthomonas sp.]|uniref:excalibur calcium-binding domain-containing protein n=1 Tax=Pseudoxanthomonas sp. TaxID=1871049 RepID=UPI002FE1850E